MKRRICFFLSFQSSVVIGESEREKLTKKIQTITQSVTCVIQQFPHQTVLPHTPNGTRHVKDESLQQKDRSHPLIIVLVDEIALDVFVLVFQVPRADSPSSDRFSDLAV